MRRNTDVRNNPSREKDPSFKYVLDLQPATEYRKEKANKNGGRIQHIADKICAIRRTEHTLRQIPA